MNFEIINKLKKEKGLTNAQIAKLSGVTLSTLDKITSGINTNPKLDTLQAICRALGCRLDDFDDMPKKSAPSYSVEALRIAKRFDELDEYGQSAVRGLVNVEYARCTALPEADSSADNCIWLPLSEQAASAGTGVDLGPEAFEQIQVLDNEKTRRAGFAVGIQGDSMEPLFHNGDIVLVSKEQPESGDIALVTLDGCGYVKHLGDGVLISENERYDPIPMNESIIVNGRVLGVLDPKWIREQG